VCFGHDRIWIRSNPAEKPELWGTGYGHMSASHRSEPSLRHVGVYALFAYAAAERRREIGVRMALGARPRDIGAMICRQALAIAAAALPRT
jgi:hypothetical protein